MASLNLRRNKLLVLLNRKVGVSLVVIQYIIQSLGIIGPKFSVQCSFQVELSGGFFHPAPGRFDSFQDLN